MHWAERRRRRLIEEWQIDIHCLMNLLRDRYLGKSHFSLMAEGVLPSFLPNTSWVLAPTSHGALASTDPGGVRFRCRAQGMRLWMRPGHCSWKHRFLISGFILFTFHCAFSSVQRRALLIHTDTGLLFFLSALHNRPLDFHFSSPSLMNHFSLDPETVGLFKPKRWLAQRWGWWMDRPVTQHSLFSSLWY